MNIENTQAQMRKGILEYCILLIIAQQDAYVPDIISKLKASKMIVVEGTIYPLLTRLKNTGLLSYRWEESQQGPPRKYWNIMAGCASITVSRNKGEVSSRNSKTPGKN